MGESYSDECCSVFSTTCPLAALIPVCVMKSVVFLCARVYNRVCGFAIIDSLKESRNVVIDYNVTL